MPVRLFSEEEVSCFWINRFNPVGTVLNISVACGSLLISGTVSVNVDSSVVCLPLVVSRSPVSDLVDVHVTSIIDSVGSCTSVPHWAW